MKQDLQWEKMRVQSYDKLKKTQYVDDLGTVLYLFLQRLD